MTDPLWVDPKEAHFPRLVGTIGADVAIVGGGLTGLGAAYGLCDAGAEVVLLEERTLSSGASGRNAGFVLAGPAMAFSLAVEQLGFEQARAVWRFTVENNRLMAELIDRYEIDCGFMRRGSMSLAVSHEEMQILIATARFLSEAGTAVCLVEREDLPSPFTGPYVGGIYYPGNSELNSAQYVRAIAGQVRGRVQIYENTTVQQIRAHDGYVLDTPAGKISAATVILATNAYTSKLWVDAPIEPKRGQVIATSPLSQVVVPFPMYANDGYQYWRQTVEGRLVVGGWRDLDVPGEVGTRELLHPAIQVSLETFANFLTPSAAVVDHRWAGIMGFTPDLFPLVGQVPGYDGVYVAAGYSGHGVSMAFSCGVCVAQQAIGLSAAIPAAFSPARFRSVSPPVALVPAQNMRA